MEDQEFKKMKMVYDKASEQHKYFLSWRQFLLGGYFAIIGALFYAAYTVFDKNDEYKKWTFVIVSSISFLSWLFLELDKRNRDLYHVCQRVASTIEQELFSSKLKEDSKDNVGLFYTLDNSSKHNDSSCWTHSELIDILYEAIILVTILLSIYLFISKTLGINCGCI